MTTAPIINALSLLDTALSAALTPLASTYNGSAAVYFMQGPPGVAGALASGSLAKAIVYALTDNGGKRSDKIGFAGWEGRVVIHCYSDTKATSNSLLASVATALNTMTIASYSVDVTWVRPTIYVPQNNIWRLSGVWDICIERV